MNLADSLLRALKAERDGHSFYMMVAGSTEDPKGRAVFETLAREELDHLQFLKEHYDSVARTGQLNESAKLGSPMDLSGDSPLYSANIKNRLGDAHYEMSALSIGIQLEFNSMNFYKSLSESSLNTQARKFFKELFVWESGHYQALLKQQEELKEDYWSESGFSPF